MPLPASGALALSQVRTELSASGALNLGASNVRQIAGKTSGTIKMSDLRGQRADGVILIAHFEGAIGATTTVDSVGNFALSLANGATLNHPGPAKYGTNCLLLSAGTLNAACPNTGWGAWLGDYTIEFWVFHQSGDSVSRYLSNGGTYDSSIRDELGVYHTYDLSAPGVGSHIRGMGILYNEWVHVAKVRSSGTTKLYVNGNSQGSYPWSAAVNLSTFYLGLQVTERFFGYIDELRISTVAKYTADFTPPSGPFA